jgi:hypothetical protein
MYDETCNENLFIGNLNADVITDLSYKTCAQ